MFDKNIEDSLTRKDIQIEYNSSSIEGLLGVISKTSFMPLSYGGNLRTESDIDSCLRNGADKIILNSAIIDNHDLVTFAVQKYGAQCVIASIDGKRNEQNSHYTFINNGQTNSGLSVIEHVKLAESLGVGEILINCCTV